MDKDLQKLVIGEILEEELNISLSRLCKVSKLPAEVVLEMIEYGIIEPCKAPHHKWQFSGTSIKRVLCAQRLKNDLGVNTAGAALAIDLLEELQELRERINRIEDLLY